MAVAPATIAVLDVGKTNIKLSAVTQTGDVGEVLSTPNVVLSASPWHHHDLASLSEWVFANLATLCRHHPITTVVPTGHGAAGVLVNDDPDELCALPQIDYEQDVPDEIDQDYQALSGSFFDRGSSIMGQAAHHARQLYWMMRQAPESLAKARWFLSIPQYWAWRLCGVGASERSCLGAQSHLWNSVEDCWTPIVKKYGWADQLPPFRHAWEILGTIRPQLQRHYNLPPLSVLTGGHDSSLNLYRYHAAGMANMRLISSGTWLVGMCDSTPLSAIDARRSMVLNSDIQGRHVGGILAKGGREFSHIAQHVEPQAQASPQMVDALIARGSFALPSFDENDGPFPGSARQGHYQGLPPQNAAERLSMAVLYLALLSVECLDALGETATIVLDGTALHDPLYAVMVAALRPNSTTLCNYGSHGIAAGAALLATHTTRTAPVPVALTTPEPYAGNVSALRAYACQWQNLSLSTSENKGKNHGISL